MKGAARAAAAPESGVTELGKRFEKLEEMIAELQARGVHDVRLTGRVNSSTGSAGEAVMFRGEILITADLGLGAQAQYAEQVMPYVATAWLPSTRGTAERAAQKRAAQRALASQLRAYRGEYQGVMNAARQHLTQQLRSAGMSIAEPDA